MFQLVHSSTVLFTALLSLAFLGKSLGAAQCASIVLLTAGLGLSTLGEELSLDSGILGGILLALVGTCASAMTYVLCERLLQRHRLPPERACFMTGLYGFALSGAYVVFYTLPQWNTLVAAPYDEIQSTSAHE